MPGPTKGKRGPMTSAGVVGGGQRGGPGSREGDDCGAGVGGWLRLSIPKDAPLMERVAASPGPGRGRGSNSDGAGPDSNAHG